ncbi:MAG: hypothetical protein O9335_16335, partial [Inhella sp.]|uniref:hypothetical protein n=1 Tax=Inhella sp. TaxID=1921806 RepID=UPI0022C69090
TVAAISTADSSADGDSGKGTDRGAESGMRRSVVPAKAGLRFTALQTCTLFGLVLVCNHMYLTTLRLRKPAR